MHTDRMRRIEIYNDEPQDDVLPREAKRRGTSKAALIRQAVATSYPKDGEVEQGAWEAIDGMFDGGKPIDDIDEVIYGPRV